jgi:hypothetical protein
MPACPVCQNDNCTKLGCAVALARQDVSDPNTPPGLRKVSEGFLELYENRVHFDADEPEV